MSFTIGSGQLDAFENNNASLLLNGNPAMPGNTVNSGDVLTAIADSGFIFTTVTIGANGYDVVQGVVTFPVPFTIQDPPTEAILEYSGQAVSGDVAEVVTEPGGIEVSGNNNVYLITPEILADVNRNRYSEPLSEGGVIDYGQYILGIISIPSDIEPELIAETTEIILGPRRLNGIEAQRLATDKIVFDMGTISVPEETGSLLDYANTAFNLHLPYSSTIAIEPRYVIGENLGIEYIIDAYSGEATINLYSTAIGGEVFYTSVVSLGINIPYTNTTTQTGNIYNPSIGVGGDNRITTPFLEQVKFEAINVDGFFTVPVVDEGTLAGNYGFIRVENSNVKVNCFANEKEEIDAMLSRGVIIND